MILSDKTGTLTENRMTVTIIQLEGADITVEGAGPTRQVRFCENGLDLEAEGADRIAGWAIAMAERIPRAGEIIEAQGCRLTVQRLRHNRITLVLIEKNRTDDGGGAEADA